MDYAYIEKLQAIIRKLHGCSATYIETVPVHEEFQGETVWQGQVEVFQIEGHPIAKHAYAWGHLTDAENDRWRYVAVLELPPVDSPQTAVQANIMAEIKDAKRKT
jgi:hypothetical protein